MRKSLAILATISLQIGYFELPTVGNTVHVLLLTTKVAGKVKKEEILWLFRVSDCMIDGVRIWELDLILIRIEYKMDLFGMISRKKTHSKISLYAKQQSDKQNLDLLPSRKSLAKYGSLNTKQKQGLLYSPSTNYCLVPLPGAWCLKVA